MATNNQQWTLLLLKEFNVIAMPEFQDGIGVGI